jgi:hypothetical protein
MADLDQLIADRLRSPDYPQWRARVAATGGCERPIRLTGAGALLASDGTVLHQHTGGVWVGCGNRRASVCEACSTRYAADAFHLLRAGLSGGYKHVPATVAAKPRAFVTLTAPSFGPVHTRRVTVRGRVVPCGCGQRHHPDDPGIGAPLDPGSYDYVGAVLWQAHAGQLWSRFATALRRALAQRLGVPGRLFPTVARLSYAKVAEYQRRGLVHFHAALRLDGPDGPADPTPPGLTPAVLREAVLDAARQAVLTATRPDGVVMRIGWGTQLDIREINPTTARHIEDPHGQISEARLAGYIAKYATKGTGKTEAADKPIHSEHHIDQLHLTPHHERLVRTIWELGGQQQYKQLNLRRWAHMLGFRGHFLTKSHHYSTTFTTIKTERRMFQITHLLHQLGHHTEDATTITLVNTWQLTGIGHHNQAEQELAGAIAHRTSRRIN